MNAHYRLILFCLGITLPGIGHASPRNAIPVTVVAVGMSPQEAETWYRVAESHMPRGRIYLDSVVESGSITNSEPPVKRWKDSLCEPLGAKRHIILVLENRSNGIGYVFGQANVCLKDRDCTLAYVSMNPRAPWESLIVIVDTRVGAMLHPITFEKIGRYDRFPSPYNLPLQIYAAYAEYRDQLSLDEFSKKTREILEGWDDENK